MEQYLHSVPGRLRLKIPTIKYQTSHAEKIQAILQSLNGIEKTTINSLTGSLIVYYDYETIKEKEILNMLQQHEYVNESRVLSMDAHIQQSAARAGQKFGKLVFGWAVGKALEANGLSFLAAFI